MILRSLACVPIVAAAALCGCGGADRDGGQEPPSREAARHGGSPTSGGAAASRISRSAIEKSLAAAEDYFNADDLPRAEAILLTLIDRAPDEPAAQELHGQVLLAKAAAARQSGEMEQAADFAQRAHDRYMRVLELSPASAGLQHSAGDIAAVAGRLDEALAHYLEAMRLDPLQPRHAIYAAQLLADEGRLDEAEDALRRALALNPDEAVAHASLANIAMQRGQFDEARTHIAEARTIRPGDLSFRLIEASIHRRAGNPHACIALLVGLPVEQRTQHAVANELATAYAGIGEFEKAAEVWAASHLAGGDLRNAWRSALFAAEHFLDAGRLEDARHWLEQARLAATVAKVAPPALDAVAERLAHAAQAARQ